MFLEKLLKVLKCYHFLWVQRRHNCSPAASFSNCVMTLYVLKVPLQTFLSVPIIHKCQILSCDALVANERYGLLIVGSSLMFLDEVSTCEYTGLLVWPGVVMVMAVYWTCEPRIQWNIAVTSGWVTWHEMSCSCCVKVNRALSLWSINVRVRIRPRSTSLSEV